MALIEGALANSMKAFLNSQNGKVQEDKDAAIEEYANNMEKLIYNAIRSIEIVIPSGMIMVQGSPSAQTNIAPIILTEVVK
jgi:hypothetical protein